MAQNTGRRIDRDGDGARSAPRILYRTLGSNTIGQKEVVQRFLAEMASPEVGRIHRI